MAPNYKFAIIQLQPKDVAVEENFAKAASYIRQAARQGAHVAVLPEYHLTSWCPDHPDFVKASAESAAYLARYQELAKELNINIVPGTICEVHSDTNNPEDKEVTEIHNMAYWISAGTGVIAGAYQKKNLWHPERLHLTAGTHIPHMAFDTPLSLPSTESCERPLRAGLLICWDLAFPEAFRALIADGADMVVIPSYWHLTDVDPVAREINPECEKLFLESAAVARAYENTCCVVFCNSGGVSQVAMPILGAVGGHTGMVEEDEERKGEVMKIVEVDFEVLRVAEGSYKVRQDIGGEGWHYGYELRRD